jgi:hypothetical protein
MKVQELAQQFGIGKNRIYAILRDLNVLAPVGSRKPIDSAAVAEQFMQGASVKALAASFGVDRNGIVRRLREQGISPRSRSDAMLLRMANTSPEDRKRLAHAANCAARGRVQSEAERILMAKTKEGSKAHVSPVAAALAVTLCDRGCPVTLEKAAGPYNLDIAFNECPVAVEIHGGHWHAYGRHGARAGKRREYLLSRGWHLIEVWVVGPVKSIDLLADKLITLAKVASLDPSGRGQHWMIGRDGEPVPALKSYGYDGAPIHAEERRCDRSGRYLGVG